MGRLVGALVGVSRAGVLSLALGGFGLAPAFADPPTASFLDQFGDASPKSFVFCWDSFGQTTQPHDASCSQTGFTHASDVNASGGQVSGYTANGEGGEHAIVWLPYAADLTAAIVYLPEDPSFAGRPDLNPGDGLPVILNLGVAGGSHAFDIDGAGNTVVGHLNLALRFAPPSEGGAIPVQEFDFLEPVYWLNSGGIWQANVLPLVPGSNPGSTLPFVGEAIAINDGGSAIAGWLGPSTQVDVGHFSAAPSALGATRWTYASGSWTAQSLGSSPDPEFGASSVATDINGDGTVLGGWYGAAATSPYAAGVGFVGTTDLFPLFGAFPSRPFIWTEALGAEKAMPLPAVGAIPGATGEVYGGVRALNATGNVAVGWAGTAGPGIGRYVGLRWEDNAGWAGTIGAPTVLSAPEGLTDFGDPVEHVAGTVANAVDASGKVIVGQVDYFLGDVPVEDEDTNRVISQAVIWDSTNAYQGQLLANVLASHGVDLQDFFLSTATAVRVTYNEEGVPQDMIVIGDGFAGEDDPMFIAHVGPNAGLISPTDLVNSVRPVPDLPVAATDELSRSLQGLGDFAENQSCFRPRGADPRDKPWCWFGYGTGTWFKAGSDHTGAELLGDIGLARLDEDHPENSGALTGGISALRVDFANGSAIVGRDVHVGGYLAHLPEQGWQLFGAGAVGLFGDVHVKRMYPNGAGTDFSSGTTSGAGYGLFGKIGYAFRPNEVKTLIPFASLSYVRSQFAGFTETGGAFPASFASLASAKFDLRLGVSGKRVLNDVSSLFGSAAWAHRLGSSGGVSVADFLFADCGGAAPMAAFCGVTASANPSAIDWFELMGGYRRELTSDSSATASLMGAFATNYLALTGRLGYARAF